MDPEESVAENTSRRPQVVVLVVGMAVSALLGVVASRSYLAWHNTLANNGNWVSTKTELARGLLGAYSFIEGRQTLAGGALHLEAWHGHNEVTYARELIEPASIEFDVWLKRRAYVVVFLNRVAGEAYDAVQFSTREGTGSGLLEVSSTGEFLSFVPFQDRAPGGKARVRPKRWHAIEIGFADGALEVSVDGDRVGRFPYAARPKQRFGFRNGYERVDIDNVVITDSVGNRRVESFDMPSGARWITGAVVVILLLANLALYGLLRRLTGAEGLELSFYFLMTNVTLLVIGGLVFVFVVMRADRYIFSSDQLAEKEAYFLKDARATVVSEARERHTVRAEDGVYRILFVGGSQTWGAGARFDEDVLVRVLERRLNQAATGEMTFECINGGISASKVRDQLRLLRHEWRKYRPQLVVLNVSSNDKSSKHFAKFLRRLVKRARMMGAEVLLVKEANSTEKWLGPLVYRHRDMDGVAAELDVPVVDMHAYLEAQEGTGFLWWDFVHLTSYGQRLMAERLLESVADFVPGALDVDGGVRQAAEGLTADSSPAP